MRQLIRIALLCVVLACNSHRGEDPEKVGRDAVAAMRQYNDATPAITSSFPDAITKLTSKILLDPSSAAKQLTDELLPKLDAYIATADRAVMTGQLYLATGVDVGSATHAQVDKLTRRLVALHGMRSTLGSLAGQLAAGRPSLTDLEQMSKDLMSAGAALLVDP